MLKKVETPGQPCRALLSRRFKAKFTEEVCYFFFLAAFLAGFLATFFLAAFFLATALPPKKHDLERPQRTGRAAQGRRLPAIIPGTGMRSLSRERVGTRPSSCIESFAPDYNVFEQLILHERARSERASKALTI